MVSERLIKALIKDLKDKGICIEDLPNIQKVIKELQSKEVTSFDRLHDLWGIKKPFGLHSLLEKYYE